MGSDPHRSRLRPHRHHRRGHARPRPRARRDDGRDDGHRQQPAGQHVALRAAVHDGGGHRERVHRGGGRVVSARADRDRARALPDHQHRQRAVAHPHAAGGARMSLRKFKSNLIVTLCGASVLLALVPLAMILFYVIKQGFSALNWDFFTQLPKPVGEAGGGMANAIVGTLILIAIAGLIAVPVGVLSGVHLAEFKGSRFSSIVRFAADVLNGVPSIVIGIFAYAIVVLPLKRFSALAGGVALAIIMIPVVARTTEELLRLVPGGLKEAALALGATRAKAMFSVILPAALPGILTGILVALARVAGETAPLLFTAFNNRFFSTNITQPIGSLTVQVFTYALSPYDDWIRQAWAGALVLVSIILILSIIARVVTRRLERMARGW